MYRSKFLILLQFRARLKIHQWYFWFLPAGAPSTTDTEITPTSKFFQEVERTWYLWEKMGTFPTSVKRYRKTVDPPISDHGGLFVKEVRTLLFLEENVPFYFLEQTLRYVYCSSMLSLTFLRVHWEANKEITPCAYRRLKTMGIIKPSAPKSFPGSRGSFSKYQLWNKPCSRFDKDPETRTIIPGIT